MIDFKLTEIAKWLFELCENGYYGYHFDKMPQPVRVTLFDLGLIQWRYIDGIRTDYFELTDLGTDWFSKLITLK